MLDGLVAAMLDRQVPRRPDDPPWGSIVPAFGSNPEHAGPTSFREATATSPVGCDQVVRAPRGDERSLMVLPCLREHACRGREIQFTTLGLVKHRGWHL